MRSWLSVEHAALKGEVICALQLLVQSLYFVCSHGEAKTSLVVRDTDGEIMDVVLRVTHMSGARNPTT